MKAIRVNVVRLTDKEVARIVEILLAYGDMRLAQKVLRHASKGRKK